METIGSRIAQRKAALGLAHREIADAAGVDESTITQWIRGRQKPKPANLAALASILRVTGAWLLYGDADVHRPNQPDQPRSTGSFQDGVNWAVAEFHRVAEMIRDRAQNREMLPERDEPGNPWDRSKREEARRASGET